MLARKRVNKTFRMIVKIKINPESAQNFTNATIMDAIDKLKAISDR